LAWAVAPFSVTFAIGGLETSLYVALLTGTLAAAVFANRSFPRLFFLPSPRGGVGGGEAEARVTLRILAALLASLALLTRPDALILLGPLALERLWSAWKKKEALHWGELAAALLPYGAWAVYAVLVFGSPLPHSVLAKAAAYRLEAGEGLIRLLQHYATPFLEQNLLGSGVAVGLGLLLYPFLFLLAVRRLARAHPRPPLALWVWALYPWLYLVTFAIPNPLIFRWYLTPPLPAYFFFIFIGLDGLLGRLGNTFSRAANEKLSLRAKRSNLQIMQRLPRPFGARNDDSSKNEAHPEAGDFRPNPARHGTWISILLLLPVCVSLADWRLKPTHGPTNPAPEMAYIQLELLYRQAADFITSDRVSSPVTAKSLLAAGDVGVLGYDTPARILDTVGLNSPVSTAYYPLPADQYVINYAIPSALILDQHPDWIVVLEVYGRRTFLADPRFQTAYELVKKIDTDMYGSDGLLIFHNR
jgi:hypothetical protein